MRFLRSVCFTLNILLLIFMGVVISDEFDHLDKWYEWVMAVLSIVTPIATCYYFMNTDDSEAKDDSLVGLWVKVKKKKLKDQLK